MKHERYKIALSYSAILLLAFAGTSSFLVGRSLSIHLHYYYFRQQVEQHISSSKLYPPTQASPRIYGKLPVFEERTSVDEAPSRIHEEMMIHPALLAHSEPKQVAIVSSSPRSIIHELLKHKTLETIWVVGDGASNEDTTCMASDIDSSQHNIQVEWVRTDIFLRAGNLTVDVVILDDE
jgi:hypothetical protein